MVSQLIDLTQPLGLAMTRFVWQLAVRIPLYSIRKFAVTRLKGRDQLLVLEKSILLTIIFYICKTFTKVKPRLWPIC